MTNAPTEGEEAVPAGAWTDDHCHLPDGPDAAAVVAAARDAGVVRMIDVAVDLVSSRRTVAAASTFDGVFATVGIHPHEAQAFLDGPDDLSIVGAMLDAPGCVAVGECGLDFHYDHSPRDVQARVFAAQIELANRHGVPLVIHTREAWAETFELLDREGVPERTIFHCFTGGPDEADACVTRGAHLSFSGIVTFPSAGDIREAAARCPLDRMLVETDSPYLAPVPHRGKKNQPAWVVEVGRALALAAGHGVEEVREATWRNATEAYRLPVAESRA